MREYEEQFTDIWRKYERSRDYLDRKALVRKTDECWRFYAGDQWHGLESGGERLPMVNFIKPILRYKTAVVSQNSMIAVYSPGVNATPEMGQACELLNEHFRQMWEKGKMDARLWEIVTAAQVQGEAYLFYGTPSDMEPQVLANVNVLLADEQEPDIQKQKYVMIYERRGVSDVREEARRRGIAEEVVETIVSDDETDKQLSGAEEPRSGAGTDADGKCSSVLYLEKDGDGIVQVARSVRNCVYQPLTLLKSENSGAGLKSYPLASFIWERMPNCARGNSEVRTLIPNQLEYNKTLARRSMAVKQCAFPRLAYDAGAVVNPDALDNVGVKIKLQNNNQKNVNEMIQYLHPQSMSGDARQLCDELLNTTRELAGAGDIATGSVDPSRASGAAIIAVKNQNELPLNQAVAAKAQFVEDIALLWFDMWTAYSPNGLEIETEEGEAAGGDQLQAGGGPFQAGGPVRTTKVISPEVLEKMKVNVRVDVSQANPFSKLAQEQALERMLAAGQITFEEYIEALDDDSNVPKRKIRDILKKRKQRELEQQTQAQAVAQSRTPAAGADQSPGLGSVSDSGQAPDLAALLSGRPAGPGQAAAGPSDAAGLAAEGSLQMEGGMHDEMPVMR